MEAIIGILITIGIIAIVFFLLVLTICLMPKIKPPPPHYDFSNDDEVQYKQKN